MKRKILGLILVLYMLTAFAPYVSATTVVDSGVCGENLTWTLDDEGTLTISGTGDMYDFAASYYQPWYDNKSDIYTVIIDEGVSSVGDSAFQSLPNITDIVISDSVVEIGETAFLACNSLVKVTFGNGITKIKAMAFEYCNNIAELHISDLSAYLNINFFYHSNPMYTGNCNLYLNDEILKSPKIPEGVVKIARDAFIGCDFSDGLIIPDSVQTIGSGAFVDCENLQSIIIPDSVKIIGANAFYNTAYYNDKNNWENNVLYIGNHLIKADEEQIGSEYVIKDGTKTIGGDAFLWCENLSKITIPNSVVGIGTNVFARTALKEVAIPDSVEYIEGSAFANTPLTEITIPDSVISIGSSAFRDCSSLTQITMSNNITAIDSNVFNGCSSLKSITMGKVTHIGVAAFNNCYVLQDIYYGGTEADWANMSVERGNERLSNINIHYGSEDNSIYKYGYLTLDLIDGIVTDCDKEAEGKIEIPSEVNGVKITQIGQYAFSECNSITEIIIPESVTEIGYNSFTDCNGLTQIVIPGSVETISNFAFLGCANLTDIDIHENIKDIGGGAFRNTGYYNNSENWDNGALYLDKYLIETNDDFTETDYKVKEDTTLIGGRAFWGRNIKSVVIPSSVKGIGGMVFSRCEVFSDIYYKGSQDEWNKIEIGEINDEISNATIHYNAIGSEPPTINGGIVYNNGDGTYYFKTDILNVQYVSYIIGALYNNGALIGMNIQPLTVGERGVGFTVNASDAPDTAKLFIWSTPKNICPLCEAKSLSIE